MNKHEAMSHSTLISYELSRRIYVGAILAEEETMSEADAFFSIRLRVVFS
nr:hypothetical protein [Evansella caseinilytica]